MNAIEIERLRKTYRSLRGGTVALDGLDLEVPRGTVFGFLGPNGSGKTTTIRCLLGLVAPTDGRCGMLGVSVPDGLGGVINRVGAIVETPAHFDPFTGRRNLDLLARVGGIPSTRVDEALETVKLTDRAHDRVKGYSLGMKQRLALASVLMKDPDLLILDEPANGLDPAGIKEVRDILRRLADQGKTVFLSSHVLAEVDVLCDHVGILSRGRCIAQGRKDEVLASKRRARLIVGTADPDRATEVLTAEGFAVTTQGDRLLVAAGGEESGRVSQILAEAGVSLTELRTETVSLEDVFLELTGEEGG